MEIITPHPHLEIEETEQCLLGKKCISLGFQVAHVVDSTKMR